MPAFSVASSPSNSSDIMGSDISEPSPSAGWSPVERTRFNQSAVLEPLQSAQSAVLEPATEPSEKCADLRLPPVYQCGCPALTCGCPALTRAAAGCPALHAGCRRLVKKVGCDLDHPGVILLAV
jgi:hypothetical protein